MRRILLTLVLGMSAIAADEPLVNLQSVDFSIRLDIRYATQNNFTKKQVYPEPKCVLRKKVALALARVQSQLKLEGYGLKVFDCYRPLSIQKKFWEIVPDERYVADPKKGSRHNRGAAVDVTLVDSAGEPLEMSSEYDDFSEKAHRDYQKCSVKAKKNRKHLEKAMEKEGFVPFATEWWHFDFKGWEEFPIEDIPLSAFH